MPAFGSQPASSGSAEQYLTDQVSLAAYLHYRGHAVDVQPSNATSNRVTFRFPRTPDLLSDINGFASAAATELRRYESSRAELRRLMDEAKRRGARQ